MYQSHRSYAHTIHATGLFIYIYVVDFYVKCR